MYSRAMDQTISYPLPTPKPQNTLKDSLFGSLKLISFIGSAFIAAYLVVGSAAQSINISLPINSLTQADSTVIASIPLKFITFPDVGKVATPHLETTILGANGSVPVTFLVDSGAKISALPLSYIDRVGLNRDTAKRIYLRSATNTTTYGYLSTIDLKVNQTTVTIPVAYADIIEPLLGTHGFFDRFTVIFENGQTLIIKQKS
jgi:hypothetical protein